jgi:hypothetical protein
MQKLTYVLALATLVLVTMLITVSEAATTFTVSGDTLYVETDLGPCVAIQAAFIQSPTVTDVVPIGPCVGWTEAETAAGPSGTYLWSAEDFMGAGFLGKQAVAVVVGSSCGTIGGFYTPTKPMLDRPFQECCSYLACDSSNIVDVGDCAPVAVERETWGSVKRMY